MSALRFGYITGPLLGALWMFILATTISVGMSLITGDPFKPDLWLSFFWGAVLGYGAVQLPNASTVASGAVAVAFILLGFAGFAPIEVSETTSTFSSGLSWILLGTISAFTTYVIMFDCAVGALTRHEFEAAVIRFLTGLGYIFSRLSS